MGIICISDMRHFHVSHLKKRCDGRFISLSLIALIGLLVCLCVVIQMILPMAKEVQYMCLQNVCAFTNPNLPKDISCVNTTDCHAWTHPCELEDCVKEGTLQCIYTGLGDFRCVCNEDYKDRLCQTPKNVSHDQNTCDFCYNGGTCNTTVGTSDYICICTESWTGRHCQQRKVPPKSDHVCTLPMHNNTDLLINTSLWYEVARSKLPHGHIDACTTFIFGVEGNNISASISSVAMNKITNQREGRLAHALNIIIENGTMIVTKQSFLSSPDYQHDKMKASIYQIKYGADHLFVIHICETTPMFGKQEVISLLSDTEPTDSRMIIQYASRMLHLELSPIIHGHDFCSS